MGLRVTPYPNCGQGTPFSLRHPLKPAGAIPSSLRNLGDGNSILPYCLFYGSVFRGSRNMRMKRMKRACSACFDESEDDWGDLLKELDAKYDIKTPSNNDDGDKEVVDEISYPISENTQQKQVKNSSQRDPLDHFRTLNPDTLEPSELGIHPKPRKWPERDELLRLDFERKINSVGIPHSLRIVQKKLKWQQGIIKEASKYTFCSLKKSFSSMVFIIQELQKYALQIRENLYCEDLQGVMDKLSKDLDASFVWLFEKVFWKTPSLMVYVMVLLANFSVFSIDKNAIIEVTPSTLISEVLSLRQNKNKQRSEDGLSDEKMIKFQSLVPPELEGDMKEGYARTQLHYKKALYHDPYNGLLLSNYAQFLYVVLRDLDE
ncbi:hypothetical protein L6164_032898 [Bauhinia variegata]|nr:hypothetical protein L6164_032898 [Bauhinia variegata]